MATPQEPKSEVDPKLIEAVVKAVLSAQPPSDPEAETMYVPKPPFHNVPGWAVSLLLGLLVFFASQTFDVFKGKDGAMATKVDQILTSVSDIKASLAATNQGQQDTNRRVETVEHDVSDLRARVDNMPDARSSSYRDQGNRP